VRIASSRVKRGFFDKIKEKAKQMDADSKKKLTGA
jgi:hypothetical protein